MRRGLSDCCERAAAGTGIAFETYSASASAAAGYVSQADLFASGRLTRDESLAGDVVTDRSV